MILWDQITIQFLSNLTMQCQNQNTFVREKLKLGKINREKFKLIAINKFSIEDVDYSDFISKLKEFVNICTSNKQSKKIQ